MNVQRRMRHVLAVLGVAGLCSTGLVLARPAAADATIPLVSFARTDYPSVSFPRAIGSADLNADLSPDLFVVDGASDTLSVLPGSGDGTFAPRTDYLAGDSPQGSAAGDLNGDAIPDVVVANWLSGDVSVFRGVGDGMLIAAGTVPTEPGTGSVALGDLNGDSILDLVATSYDSSTASVFRGVGDGTFDSRSDYATPFPGRVALADLDRDSRLDMAVTGVEDSTVSVFLGMGDGTFGSSVAYPTWAWPTEVVAADLNADAILDLVVADFGANSLSVLRGVGDGTFGPTSHLPLTFSTVDGPTALAVSDFNGDSVPDIATVNDALSIVQILWGLGDANFTTPPTGISTGDGPVSITAADFNGDSRVDLAVAGYGSVSVLLNGGPAAVPGAPTNVTASAGNGRATVSWAPPTFDGGLPITGYTVIPFLDATAQAPVMFSSAATTQTITGLTNGATYTFAVAATTAVGTGPNSDQSNPVTPAATVPEAPTMLRNATAANQSATISWVPPGWDGGSPISGYIVTPYVDYWSGPSVVFNSTATSQTVTGLTNGVTYRFKVAAINTAGTGPTSKVSNPVTPAPTVPGAPIIGSATAGDGDATVSWIAPTTDGGSPIIGYVVVAYIGYGPVRFWVFDSTVTTGTVTGLSNGTTYRFRVTAYNAIGNGPYSRVTNPATPSA